MVYILTEDVIIGYRRVKSIIEIINYEGDKVVWVVRHRSFKMRFGKFEVTTKLKLLVRAGIGDLIY